ncbi:helix-turn-helix domain-containing protein [Bradyrhizobium diazoefficiens]
MDIGLNHISSVQNAPLKQPTAPIVNLGGIELLTVSSDHHATIAEIGELARERNDKFILMLVDGGSVQIAQRGRRCRIERSQYALFDCSAGITVVEHQDVRLLCVFIPHFQLHARLRNIPAIVAQKFAATGSPWRIAANLARALSKEIKHIPLPLTYTYAGQLVETVSIAIETDLRLSDFSAREALFRRCASFVRNNLADRSLDPQKIADAMRISVRYLHKVFEQSGESVCEFLRATRLEASKLELADPQKASIQIREIAHRVGFRSQAHFAAAFKSRYGVSATEWRRTSMRTTETKTDEMGAATRFGTLAGTAAVPS